MEDTGRTDTMVDDDVAIRISGLKKEYRLGMIGSGTLQKDLQSWWARVRGKEDPNSIIGSNSRERIIGERLLALNGIDLTVRRGETLGIIGKNGAGKSTLLKVLARITSPSAGMVELFGRVTSMLEVGTGFHGEMTGRENIYMNGAILGMSRAEIDEAMEDIIEFSEIRDFIDTPVKRYSSGMYVKLAFSVAAHLKGEIMIMDEVLAVGDMAFQAKCLEAMRRAATEEGRAVLYVSHNMNTIRRLCNRCIVMDEGRIIFDGNTEEAIALYMDSGRSEDIRKDYPSAPSFKWLTNRMVCLTSAEFLDRKDNRFDEGEAMHLRLEYEYLADVENLCLRLEIYTLDDVPQGTYFLYDVGSGSMGDRTRLDLLVDVGPLACASYFMKYTFFERSMSGGHRNLECRDGLTFDRIDTAGTRLSWETQNWGYVELRGASILSCNRIGANGE